MGTIYKKLQKDYPKVGIITWRIRGHLIHWKFLCLQEFPVSLVVLLTVFSREELI